MVVDYEFKNKIPEKEIQIRTRIKENKNIEKLLVVVLCNSSFVSIPLTNFNPNNLSTQNPNIQQQK